jgi:hypothetical protein
VHLTHGQHQTFGRSHSGVVECAVFDIAASPDPSVADDFDLLAIGTPVMGMRSTPEVHSFVKRLPECAGKKTILFCTYAIRQGGTLKVLEKELTQKGYVNILNVSKRGIKLNKTDFTDILNEINKAVSK